MSKNKRSSGGFTLLELLVVIAIIGVLASIILVSLSSARQKARDVQRVSDIRQLKNALQLYFYDNNGTYPTVLTTLVPKYIPSIPHDPLGTSGTCTPSYCYAYSPSSNPTLFQLAANLETQNAVLTTDADFNSTAAGYTGTTTTGADSPNYIYDVTQ